MCVAALAWQAHPAWHLVAIGNRDEYHARPAAPLARWPNGILAGQDLKSGGTWLGVSPGRFALVTNLRGYDLPDPDKASRGALVTDQLTGTGPYSDPATTPLGDFNPFNLIVADGQAAHFLCNRPGEIRTALPHGIYGLSNGALDEPWPKTLQLKAALTDWLHVGSADPAPLFAALASESLADIGLHTAILSDVPLEAPEDSALHPQSRLWHPLQHGGNHRPARPRHDHRTAIRCPCCGDGRDQPVPRLAQLRRIPMTELYAIELPQAMALIAAAGRDPDQFTFAMEYLPPDPDGGGMFTVHYMVTVTNTGSGKSQDFIGGIGMGWVEQFADALAQGLFD